MFRKLLLAGAAAAALVVPALGTSKAQAGSFGFDVRYGHRGGYGYRLEYGHRPHHCHFQVLYRDCWHSPWRCYGEYHSEYQAYRVADWLHCRGYSVRVSHQ